MPRRQPFTTLCHSLSAGPSLGRADLHLHTTYSDGSYSPEEIVDLAKRSGLAAIAITDHDTLDGVIPARLAAGSRLEVIAGVEISAEYRNRELHLLGYFVDLDHEPLQIALERLRVHRQRRFWNMVVRLREQGVDLQEDSFHAQIQRGALGRRNLAVVLEQTGKVRSVREAFTRYLGDDGRIALPKVRLPVEEAVALVKAAGGVAAWAHPSYDCDRDSLTELSGWGLGALETEYHSHRPSRGRELRALAAQFGLAITGGSDCHGPEPVRQTVGACSITIEQLTALREKCS